jgi:hypothetical protein
MKPHSVSAFSAFDDDTSVSSSWKVTASRPSGGLPLWKCQSGLRAAAWPSCCGSRRELLIVVDIARDHVEIQPLRRLGSRYMNSDSDSGEA